MEFRPISISVPHGVQHFHPFLPPIGGGVEIGAEIRKQNRHSPHHHQRGRPLVGITLGSEGNSDDRPIE